MVGMTRAWILALALTIGAVGCGKKSEDSGPGPWAPHAYCPGPDCPDEAGVGPLLVGASAVDVSPIAYDEALGYYVVVYNGDRLEVHDDLDGNGRYNPSTETYEDWNGNGVYDGQWLAGFGTARGAAGANDSMWARAIALRHENTTMVLVAIDCVGLFKGEMDQIRASVADLGVNHILIAATHGHQTRDTIGLWGINEFTTGVDPAYMDYLRDRTEDAIREAVAALETAHVQYASFFTRDLTVPPEGSPDGVERFHGDNRDPNIVDDEVRLLRFIAADEQDRTIATLVNWAAHPEYVGYTNQLLSSDFAHFLRQGIEEGLTLPADEAVPGLGGIAVFFPGALGGQIGPNHVDVRDWEGNPIERFGGFPAGEAVGEQLAYFVLQALGDDGGSVTDMTAELGFRTRELDIPVQNIAFHLAAFLDIFDRDFHGHDPDLPISEDNLPYLLSEVTVVDIGRAQLMTAPGELHPEIFVGGYDGSYTPEGQSIIRESNSNPPNLADAPGPPYLRDRARADAEFVFLLGLGNDFVGYLLPEWNFVLDESSPYLSQAPGHHYEETNSPGPLAWPTIEAELVQLLEWQPPD
jgi:hypothetical protein